MQNQKIECQLSLIIDLLESLPNRVLKEIENQKKIEQKIRFDQYRKERELEEELKKTLYFVDEIIK